MQTGPEWAYGTFRAHFEEPDLLVVKSGGDVTLEVAKALTDLYREKGLQRPIFLVVHVSQYALTQEARAYMSRNLRPEWFRATIFVGTSVVQRAMGKAFLAGMALVGKWLVEGYFTATEEEARALVQQLREKQAPPPPA